MKQSKRWMGKLWCGLGLFLCACLGVFQGGCQAPVEGVSLKEVALGVAIAGFQGDMGCPTVSVEMCDDKNSDWYQWVTTPEIAQDKEKLFSSGDPIAYSSGQWELYEQDYKMAKEQMGVRTFRMSVEWSRIFPTSTEGIEGYEELKKIAHAPSVERYRKKFQTLRSLGIKPLVTINHYTLPLWIHNGVECHKSFSTCKDRGWAEPTRLIPEIVKFAGFMAREYAAEVDDWVTINEPLAIVLPGYIQPTAVRVNPPALSFQFDAAKTVIRALIEAHAKIYDAIKANDDKDADGDGKNAYIGIAYNYMPFKPRDPNNNLDVEGAKNATYLVNDVFLNAIALGKYDENLDGTQKDRPDLKRLDFLGVNFYGSISVPGIQGSLFPDFSPLLSFNALDFKQEVVDPKGLYESLVRLKEYGLPMQITESGVEMRTKEDEEKMPAYLVRHLFWIARANLEGAKVESYHYWSLVDNYEWNHGLDLKFGLFAYDPQDQQKKRVARPGVSVFKQIADAGALTPAILSTYLTADEKALIPDILKNNP